MDPTLLAAVAALALVVVLGAALVVSRRRTAVALEAARRDAEALAARIEALEKRPAAREAVTRDETAHVVTMLGVDEPEGEVEAAPVVPAPLFADLVLREGAVQAVSLAAGLRRALAPEVRHRIRWEMKREVKRARKQRRADLRQAKREFEDRQRAEATSEERAA